MMTALKVGVTVFGGSMFLVALAYGKPGWVNQITNDTLIICSLLFAIFLAILVK